MADLVDLVCTRYPGTKPSDYLEIEDNWTAFQLDASLALKYHLRDEAILVHRANVSNWHILQVCKVMGGGKNIPKQPPKMPSFNIKKDEDEIPKLSDMLEKLGGKGTVLKKEFKNG